LEVEIIKENERELIFKLIDTTPDRANTLRRTIIADVPTMAIDEVIFLENTTIFFDEYIAHRLGLIPFKTDLKTYKLPEECECGGAGCSRCTANVSVEKIAETDGEVLLSGDLVSEDADIRPVNPNIPIVKMRAGDKIAFQAILRLGTGREHAKWQPVSKASYKYTPYVVLTGECDGCGICIESCPRRALGIENGKPKIINELECRMCRICEDACPNKVLKIAGDPTRIIFMIESTGALPAREIVIEACRTIVKRLSQLENQIKEIKSEE